MRPSQSGSTDKVSPQRRLRFRRDAVHESVVEMDLTPTDGSECFSRIELCALRRLDGRRLLSEAGMQTMLANHIGDLRVPVLKTEAPPLTADVDILPGTRKSHGIAFMRFDEGAPGMRSPGSHGWAGVLNTHYWLDPARDLAAVLMTQSLPFVEPRFMAAYEDFERAVYRGAMYSYDSTKSSSASGAKTTL